MPSIVSTTKPLAHFSTIVWSMGSASNPTAPPGHLGGNAWVDGDIPVMSKVATNCGVTSCGDVDCSRRPGLDSCQFMSTNVTEPSSRSA
eukprot:5918145-Prymnesium_polylepis.1